MTDQERCIHDWAVDNVVTDDVTKRECAKCGRKERRIFIKYMGDYQAQPTSEFTLHIDDVKK